MPDRVRGFFWMPSLQVSQPLAVAVPFVAAAPSAAASPGRVLACVRSAALALGLRSLVDVSSFDIGVYPGAPPVPPLPPLQLRDGSRVPVLRAIRRVLPRGCPAPARPGAPAYPAVSLALGPAHGCARLHRVPLPYAYVWLMLRALADGPGLAWAVRYAAVSAVLAPRPPWAVLSPAMAVAAGVALMRLGYSLDWLTEDYRLFSRACRASAPGALATGASAHSPFPLCAGAGDPR